MSLRVVGYRDGRRIVEDLGPARARPTGYGGQALGSVIAATVVAPPPKVKIPRQALAISRGYPLCGAVMPLVQETCARRAGHKDCHRSAVVMETDRVMRRSNRMLIGR
jgi:hypothetical protein